MMSSTCDCGHAQVAHVFLSDGCTLCTCPLFVPPRAAIAKREQALKADVLDGFEGSRADTLARIRDVLAASPSGTLLTADDAYAVYMRTYDFDATRPAVFLGSVFKDDRFQFTGDWRLSARLGNHSRGLRVWRRV
jgi:hypothetical protein